MKLFIQKIALISIVFTSLAATGASLLTLEPIQTAPTSTKDLWGYSYKTGVSLSSNQYISNISLVSGAVHQGYVTGNTHSNTSVDYFTSNGVSGNNNTAHVFSTYIMSTINQSLSFAFDGDDGHALFLDNVFLSGGGYSIDAYATIAMIANVPYDLTLVGSNAGGPWSWWLRGLPDATNVLMDATGDFDTSGAVPEPATLLLISLGLIGIRRVRKQM